MTTKETAESSRGGKREGAGRPSTGLSERLNIRVTLEEKVKLDKLGGSEWIRAQIQGAKAPSE